jgi:hypothetical protein
MEPIPHPAKLIPHPSPVLRPLDWCHADPLNLSENAGNLARFTESEVIHGRWAMLGVAGALALGVAATLGWGAVVLALRKPPAPERIPPDRHSRR